MACRGCQERSKQLQQASQAMRQGDLRGAGQNIGRAFSSAAQDAANAARAAKQSALRTLAQKRR